jgi:PIN domain nuclease of toxin-antitoxin system
MTEINPVNYYSKTSEIFEELKRKFQEARLIGNEDLEKQIEQESYALGFEVYQFTSKVIDKLKFLQKNDKDPVNRKNYQVLINRYKELVGQQARDLNALIGFSE